MDCVLPSCISPFTALQQGNNNAHPGLNCILLEMYSRPLGKTSLRTLPLLFSQVPKYPLSLLATSYFLSGLNTVFSCFSSPTKATLISPCRPGRHLSSVGAMVLCCIEVSLRTSHSSAYAKCRVIKMPH